VSGAASGGAGSVVGPAGALRSGAAEGGAGAGAEGAVAAGADGGAAGDADGGFGAAGSLTFLRGCCASGSTSGPFWPHAAAAAASASSTETRKILMPAIIPRGAAAPAFRNF